MVDSQRERPHPTARSAVGPPLSRFAGEGRTRRFATVKLMGAFLDLLSRNPHTLWLDSHAYCAKLLAGGNAPWLDVAGYVAWQRKAQGLLKPSVVALPLAPVIEAWLSAHAELREAMAAKTRAVFPLKTLLAEESLRVHLVELARALRAGVAGMPLALVLPSPRAWVALAHGQAHGASDLDVGEDEADSASMYVADFLRAFGEAGVDALLLAETESSAPVSAQDLDCYQSVLNIAAHYRWDVGLQLQQAAGSLPASYAFAVAPQALDGTPTGIVLGDSFWNSEDAPSAAFHYAQIPPEAKPERVLQRLASLR